MQFNDTVTLNGIKQDIYFEGKINATTYNANDLNRIINKYYKIAQEDLRAINEDFFLISIKADLQLQSVNQAQYSWPSDMEKVKKLFIAPTPVSAAAPLATEYVPAAFIDQSKITDPSYVFSNPTAVIFGTYFILYPFYTDATKYPVTGGVKLYYIPLQADLSADADTPLFFADYHDVITWGSLIDIGVRKGDATLIKKADEMFKQRRKEMKADASNRVVDYDPEYLEGQGSNGGWNFPFGRSTI